MQDAINSFSNIVLQAVLPVLIATLAGLAAMLIKKGISYAQANIDKKTQLQLEWLAGLAVTAAEQSGLSGQLQALGVSKKEWALAQLEDLLRQYKLPALDMHTLSALIESEVYKQFTVFKKDEAKG